MPAEVSVYFCRRSGVDKRFLRWIQGAQLVGERRVSSKSILLVIIFGAIESIQLENFCLDLDVFSCCEGIA